jgi:toxin ParE1/3/4
MLYSVHISSEAEQDIDIISVFITDRDGPGRATRVIQKIYTKIKNLRYFPERHGYTLEYCQENNHQYRETLSGPYRIFYRIDGTTVYVIAVADGRRDIEAFLIERLR